MTNPIRQKVGINIDFFCLFLCLITKKNYFCGKQWNKISITHKLKI